MNDRFAVYRASNLRLRIRKFFVQVPVLRRNAFDVYSWLVFRSHLTNPLLADMGRCEPA